MVQITSFIVLALSALPTFIDAAHIPSHIHQRAALQIRDAHRGCARDKVVPPPTKNLDKESKSASSKKSATSTSAKSSKTPSSSSGNDGGNDNTPVGGGTKVKGSALFPMSGANPISAFSTASGAGGKSEPLSDATFHPLHKSNDLPYTYGSAPDGKRSLISTYKKGSISPGHGNIPGGFSFYSPTPIDLTDGNTVTMSYSVMFDKGFSFNRGGKLPGLYGGDNEDVARTCSGGRHNAGCWSTRLMWREGGKMELYAYLPLNAANKKGLTAVPHSGMGDGYGASVGRGLFTFKPGQWATVAQRVTLNTPGKNDGSIEVYVNGRSLFVAHGLYFRSSSKGKVWGMQVQTFFGGHERDWASPKTQRAYFADFSCGVYH